MSGIEQTKTRGGTRDTHLHSASPPGHRDPSLVALGAAALLAGLGLLAWCAVVVADLPVAVLPAGFLAVHQLWTARDLLDRRRHAWRQDAFAGQSSLWVALLFPAFGGAGPVVVVALAVMVLATLTALALTCTGGARRSTGLVVAAVVAGTGWCGPVLWAAWTFGGSPPALLVTTPVLLAGAAVPVLAVTAMPAACGRVVVRSWALWAVFAVVLQGVAGNLGFSSPVALLTPFVVVPACAVVLALAVSVRLGRVA
ncbi:hypothetical protein [Lentzea sp. NPDC060358]|uniref:hypothetical protein n=1 Tax=Lentzea sp. NPDC060358 TaxID=3347103 RepID=UPI00364FBCA0